MKKIRILLLALMAGLAVLADDTYDDVYVTQDGSDDNAGNTADAPLATLAAAQAKLNAGGTLHLGAGTFSGTFALQGAGARIVGAGRGQTLIRSSSSSASGISLNAHSQVVEDLAVEGPKIGVLLNQTGGINLTNVVLRGCEIRNCSNSGVYMTQDKVNAVQYTNVISHCVVSNCTSYGVCCVGNHGGGSRKGFFFGVDSLFAFNGEAIYNDFQGGNQAFLYNCTVASNKTYGVRSGNELTWKIVNSILFGNATKNVSTGSNPLTLDHSLYNGLLSYTGSLTVKECYAEHDPAFEDGFQLSEDSFALKTGADVSGLGTAFATDLAGASWGQKYDMGCFKSAYEKVKTYDEVWVAKDGSDANEGNASSAPLATFAMARAKLNPGGTLHVGAGTFTSGYELNGAGARIVGAGRGKTTLKTTAANGVLVTAHGQSVEDLAIDGPTTGVNLKFVGSMNPTNVVVCGCEIRNCSKYGVYMAQDNVNAVPYTNFVSRCVISNCASYGVYWYGYHGSGSRKGHFVGDNSLFAFNGVGICCDNQGGNRAYLYNCTVVSNATSGASTTTESSLTLTNCILFDNGAKNAGGSSLTMSHSLCNGLLSSSTIVNDGSYLSHDPKFGENFTLTQRSLANKNGADVSSLRASFATDLSGAAWGGAYDMGCFKSPWPLFVPNRYDEIWVATDGDNDNEGNAPDAPLATLTAAQNCLNDGGTLHVGAGTFTDRNFTLRGNGAKMLGAGMERTIIKIPSECGTIVAGHSALVEGITYVGGTYGVRIGEADEDIATNCTVRSCAFRGCGTGWYAMQDNNTDGQFTNFVSHCLFSNCTARAIRWQGIHTGSKRYGRLLADTCLIANCTEAFTSDLQPSHVLPNVHAFVNCTFANNGAGFSTGSYLGLTFCNCIIVDSGDTACSTTLTMRHVLSNGKLTGGTTSIDAACVTNVAGVAALGFSARPGKEYWPTGRSPARRFGDRALAAGLMAHDLAGRAFKGASGWDAGCYFAEQPGARLIIK